MFNETKSHWHNGDQPRIKWKDVKGFFWPSILISSNKVKYLSAAESSRTGAGGSQGTLKAYTVRKNGTVIVNFDFKTSAIYDSIRLHLNGVEQELYIIDDESYNINTWYSSNNHELTVFPNDVISLLGYSFNTGDSQYVRNFSISYDVEKIKYNHKVILN